MSATPRTDSALGGYVATHPHLIGALEEMALLENEHITLKAKVRAYLAERSIDGRFCRAAMRAELAELSK